MGGYRQWKLFNSLGFPDSNKTHRQIERFTQILNQWTKALKETEVIVLMDTNIDTLTDSQHNTKYRTL